MHITNHLIKRRLLGCSTIVGVIDAITKWTWSLCAVCSTRQKRSSQRIDHIVCILHSLTAISTDLVFDRFCLRHHRSHSCGPHSITMGCLRMYGLHCVTECVFVFRFMLILLLPLFNGRIRRLRSTCDNAFEALRSLMNVIAIAIE